MKRNSKHLIIYVVLLQLIQVVNEFLLTKYEDPAAGHLGASFILGSVGIMIVLLALRELDLVTYSRKRAWQLSGAVMALMVFITFSFFFWGGYGLSDLINLVNLISPSVLVYFSMSALFVAVLEEIIFRRYILNFLRNMVGIYFAIPISAAVFMAAHLKFAPDLFLSGFIYAVMAVYFRSLALPISMHLYYNCIGLPFYYVHGTKSILFKETIATYDTLRAGSALGELVVILGVLVWLGLWFGLCLLRWIKHRHSFTAQSVSIEPSISSGNGN